MPESYAAGDCHYQALAQPYLEAIALGVKSDARVREYLLEGTDFALSHATAVPLWQEQWKRRDPQNAMHCPFWSNYWYEPCDSCTCRVEASVSMEVDAMFFLSNRVGEVLALHIEMKRDGEPLSHGQAEAYRPRAECWRDERRKRRTLLKHHHFLTVLFCGRGTDLNGAKSHFDRVILHEAARRIIPGYPASSESSFRSA